MISDEIGVELNSAGRLEHQTQEQVQVELLRDVTPESWISERGFRLYPLQTVHENVLVEWPVKLHQHHHMPERCIVQAI